MIIDITQPQPKNQKEKYLQWLMWKHDHGDISASTLMEAFGLDYDEEIKRMKKIQREGIDPTSPCVPNTDDVSKYICRYGSLDSLIIYD